MDAIITGRVDKPVHNNVFTRFHQSIEDYPYEMDNMDDYKLYTTDNFERLKPLMPKKGTTVGTTSVIPVADTDEKLIFYDTQGESLYTNPPDPNMPTIDHGLDEFDIWNFRKSNYNQKVIYNPYTRDVWGAMKESHAPRWGLKLSSPIWFTREKQNKFFEQYALRLDFEVLKMKHAKEFRRGDLAQRDRQTQEVSQFLEQAQKKVMDREFGDVYVTDHKHVAPKYSTLTDEENAEYYHYMRKLQDYNAQPFKEPRQTRFNSGRYEKGSMLQRILEPLAGAETMDNGTVFYELTEKEIAGQLTEEKLRAKFEKLKTLEALEGEDQEEVQAMMFDQLEAQGINLEEWDKILAQEFNTFKEGESYDYVTDLRRTYDASLAESTASKIFRRIPDHVFWDIKKPQVNTGEKMNLNPYNTARKYPFETFFEMRQHEEWLKSKEEQRNLNNNISKHTRY